MFGQPGYWHCSRWNGSEEPKLSPGITISHCRRSPVLNGSLVMQYSPSLLRFSVVLSTGGLPDCRNKRTGQCTATRLRLRPDKATARSWPACHEMKETAIAFGLPSSARMLSARASARNGLWRNAHSQGIANFSAIRADDASVTRRARIWGWMS